jgi:Type VI secretion system (T6SS), amidase effector protein 4
MFVRFDFDDLWSRHPRSREFGRDVNPGGNRCALVLGATLRNRFKPRPGTGELSFKDISEPANGIRGQPFLAKYYVKALDFANRLHTEWGPPDVRSVGTSALGVISGLRGVIFLEDAWATGRISGMLRGLTVDHVDLWNGQRMGAYNESDSATYIQRAKFVELWLPSPRHQHFDPAVERMRRTA